MKKLFLTTCLMLGTLSAHAASEDNKQVGLIAVNNGTTSFTVKNPTTSAGGACLWGLLVIRDTRTSPSFPSDPVVYQSWYSGLLAAQKAGTTVTVGFTPQSDTICRVDQINFN
jgi:hypothetical protein